MAEVTCSTLRGWRIDIPGPNFTSRLPSFRCPTCFTFHPAGFLQSTPILLMMTSPPPPVPSRPDERALGRFDTKLLKFRKNPRGLEYFDRSPSAHSTSTEGEFDYRSPQPLTKEEEALAANFLDELYAANDWERHQQPSYPTPPDPTSIVIPPIRSTQPLFRGINWFYPDAPLAGEVSSASPQPPESQKPQPLLYSRHGHGVRAGSIRKNQRGRKRSKSVSGLGE